MKHPISSIFLLKALGAIFVVMIHFYFYKSQYMEPLYRCGVPIFFIIGGYFLYTSDRKMLVDKVKRSFVKMLKLILFFNAMYFMINKLFIDGWYFDISDSNKIFRLIVYGDSISGHLWFLHSYVWTLITIGLLAILKAKVWVYNLLAVALLLLCFLNGQYSFLLPFHLNVQKFWMPWILMSYPMFIVGANIHKYEKQILKFVTPKLAMGGTFVCVLLCYMEHRLLSVYQYYTAETEPSTLLLVMMMLVLCLTKKEYGKDSWIETLGRNHSGNIYYWQFIPSIIVCPIITSLNLKSIEFFIMFAVLIIWSFGVNYINGKLKPILHY